jgi:hypothetical protein
VGADEGVILTGGSPHRVQATLEAVRSGRNPTVVAAPPLLDWLRGQGALVASEFPATFDGVSIAAMPYTPPRTAGPLAAFLRASVAGVREGRVRPVARASDRAPACEPQVVCLTFPDGSRLLHLDLALHEGTDEAWVRRAAEAFGGAEWVIVGSTWEQSEALVRHLPAFGADKILVTELVNAERREVGLPTALVTPVRDRLVAAGLAAHVFATQTSYRFE